MLGPLEVIVDGRSVALGAPKQRGVLLELLLNRGRVLSRSALIDALWPDAPPDTATAALQVYVHGLRRVLGSERIETRDGGYRLQVGAGELDLDVFASLVARAKESVRDESPAFAAEDLRAALALRRGAALAELDEPPFLRGRALVERQLVEAIELLADAELALGRHELILGELEAAIASHPYRERLREQAMLALYRAGRASEALAAYQAARRTLDEIGLEPGQGLRELQSAILRNDQQLDLPPEAARVSRVPVVATRLVGREEDVAALCASMRRRDVRLTTLTGPGGIGKTRLALAAAAVLSAELVDGAAFVDLAPIGDSDRVLSAIAEALELPEDAAPMGEYIANRSLLLVIDNFEQVVNSADVIASLLASAPRLRVLVTSRVPLRLTGEHVYPVQPLPVPARALPTYDELRENDAVQLFAERAQAVDAQFELTPTNIAFVAEICRALDGLPLAIELAAARTRLFSVETLVELLGEALDVFSDNARDRPARQQTLRATLDWSYRLLEAEDRLAFATLAVFSDGFTANAAAGVLDREDALLTRLSRLLEANLIRRRPRERGTRFGMLETVRTYAGERLASAGSMDDARLLHACYFLDWAEAPSIQDAASEGSAAMLDDIDDDIENVRAALRTFADRGDTQRFARLTVALRQYWLVRGHLSEGRAHFEQAFSDVREPSLRAAVLAHGAVIPYRQGAFDRAKELWREALDLYETLDDLDGTSRCQAELAAVAVQEGDLDTASAGFLRCCDLFEQLGQRVRLGIALANLAAIESMRRNFVASASYGERAVALQLELNDLEGLAFSAQNLAGTYLELGSVDEANGMLNRSLDAASALGYQELLGYAFATASALTMPTDPESAARLLGAAEQIFTTVGAEIQESERESFAHLRVSLLHELGDEHFTEASDSGRLASIDEMVELARR